MQWCITGGVETYDRAHGRAPLLRCTHCTHSSSHHSRMCIAGSPEDATSAARRSALSHARTHNATPQSPTCDPRMARSALLSAPRRVGWRTSCPRIAASGAGALRVSTRATARGAARKRVRSIHSSASRATVAAAVRSPSASEAPTRAENSSRANVSSGVPALTKLELSKPNAEIHENAPTTRAPRALAVEKGAGFSRAPGS